MNSKYDYYIRSSDGNTIVKKANFNYPIVFTLEGNKKKLSELSLKERLGFNALAIHDAKSNLYVILNPYSKNIIINSIDIDENILNNVLYYFKEKGFQLKEYQIKALRHSIKMRRVPLMMTVGSGKTIVALSLYYYLKLKNNNNPMKAVIIMRQRGLIEEWKNHIEKLGFDKNDFIIINLQKIQSIYDAKNKKVKIENTDDITEEQRKILDILQEDNAKIDLLIIDEITDGIISDKKTSSHEIARILSYKSNYLIMLTGDFGARNDPYKEYKHYLILIGYDTSKSGLNYLRKAKKDKIKGILQKEDITKEEIRKLLTEALETILSSIAFHYDIKKQFIENIQEIKITDLPEEIIDNITRVSAHHLLKLREEYRKYEDGDIDKKELHHRIMKILTHFHAKLFILTNGFSYSSKIKPNYLNIKHPKLQKLKELIKQITDRNERVVVYGIHKKLGDILQIIAKELNIPYYEFSGKRKDNLEEYVKQDKAILFLSKAGERGINVLKNEKNLIIFEFWWTYHSLIQLIGRFERVDSTEIEKNIYSIIVHPDSTHMLKNIIEYLNYLEGILKEKYIKNEITADKLKRYLLNLKDIKEKVKVLLDKWKYYSTDLWAMAKIREKLEYAKRYKKKANIYQEIIATLDETFKGQNDNNNNNI